MAWRDNLVQASFRGVRFSVDETEAPIAGRRVAVHEYPGRDQPFVEDMGRVTKRWTVEAFVLGDDYDVVRDELIEASDMPGPGELVHPYLGSLQVFCTACSLTERPREGRMARFSPLVRGGRRESVSVERREHDGSRAHAGSRSDSGDHRSVQRRLRALMAFASFVADAAIALVRAAADEIGGPAATTLREQCAGARLQRRPARARRGRGCRRRDRRRQAGGPRVQRARHLSGGGRHDAQPQPRADEPGGDHRLRARAQPPCGSPSGSASRRTATASRRGPSGTPRPRRWTSARPTRALRCSGRCGRLRAGVVEHVREEILRLPPVIIATPASVQPSLAIAYDIYEDIDRAADIVGRAVLPRPGFVPANPITLPGE